MNHPVIKTASSFEQFMLSIWSDHAEPAPGGSGIILYFHPQYDTYRDAVETLRMLHIPRSGSTKVNSERWDTYRFSDDSRIAVNREGSAIKICPNKYSRRRKIPIKE